MRPWIVWATGLLAYIVAVLDRTTLGVSGLDAADRFSASPSLLSTFVVLQVIVYAGAQVPAGLLLDRFGSKALILAGAALMASGQLVLAFTESMPTAVAARAVVGLGDALTFISVLRLVPHWFTPRQVPLVTQLTGICGQLGQVLSAVPFLAVLVGFGLDRRLCVGRGDRRAVHGADPGRGEKHPERPHRRNRIPLRT